jgi:hypothetical protein
MPIPQIGAPRQSFFGGLSEPGGVDLQAGVGQFPQLHEALPPGIDVIRVVNDERTAWLVDVKTTHPVRVISQQMGIGKVA